MGDKGVFSSAGLIWLFPKNSELPALKNFISGDRSLMAYIQFIDEFTIESIASIGYSNDNATLVKPARL